MIPSFEMYLPSNAEYDILCQITRDDDNIMHWNTIATWVSNAGSESYVGTARGFTGPRDKHQAHEGCADNVGFRPAFKCITPQVLIEEDMHHGDIIVVGSLYMGGKPVRIQEQFDDKRISHYRKGAKLELRDAIELPNSVIWGIYIGNDVFIADRPVLRDISLTDIGLALQCD